MGGGNSTESQSLPLKRAVKVYQTAALRRFAPKLPGSSQELMTALKRKKARQQGLTFFLQGRGAVRDEEGCHRLQEKSQHLLKPQTKVGTRAHSHHTEGLTWQDSEHLPRVGASSGSTSVKKQRNLFRTGYNLSSFYRKELCSHAVISGCFISPVFRSPCFD